MIGRTIGNYRLEVLLGQGGMGAVYRGTDVLLDRPVAIKSLRADVASNPQLVERFRQEARTLARLLHPNIATLYTLVRDGEDMYMVMEFCEGETLESILKRCGKLSVQEALQIIDQAMRGLEHAHHHGIVHRDIKPANLMRLPDGTIKVMDFGIARLRGSSRLTQTSHTVGTAEYMAPEQIRAQDVDARADIYALGILLFELLTGRLPFTSESFFEVMQAHLQQPPPPPGQFVSGLGSHIEEAILKALEKDRDKRFNTIGSFREALRITSDLPAFLTVRTPRSFGLRTRMQKVSGGMMSGVRRMSDVVGQGVAWAKANPVPSGLGSVAFVGLTVLFILLSIQSRTITVQDPQAFEWVDNAGESGGWSGHEQGTLSWNTSGTSPQTDPSSYAITLAEAQRLYDADQLTMPADANALLLAERVLQGNPGHAEAQSLIRNIASRLVTLGEEAQRRNQNTAAQRYFEQAVYVGNRHPVLARDAQSRANTHLAALRTPTPQPERRQEPSGFSETAQPATIVSGSVRVIVRPYGDVYVNGRRYAQNTNAPVLVGDLPPGSHQVLVRHPELGTQERTVTVRAGQQADIRIEFATSIEVTVTSDPPNGEIFLNGRSTGRYTPANVSIPPGQNTVEVRRDGFRPGTRVVVNDGRNPDRVSFTLTPIN